MPWLQRGVLWFALWLQSLHLNFFLFKPNSISEVKFCILRGLHDSHEDNEGMSTHIIACVSLSLSLGGKIVRQMSDDSRISGSSYLLLQVISLYNFLLQLCISVSPVTAPISITTFSPAVWSPSIALHVSLLVKKQEAGKKLWPTHRSAYGEINSLSYWGWTALSGVWIKQQLNFQSR